MHRRRFLKAAAGLCLGANSGLSWAVSQSSLVAAAYGRIPAGVDIRRVLSAGPIADVLLISLAPEKLLGISTHNIPDGRKRFFSDTIRALPNTGRLAGRASTLPLEKLIALKPDLIVDVGSTSASYISVAERVFEQTGIPYVVISGRLEASNRQLALLGGMLGEEQAGQAQSAFADQVLNMAERARALGRQPVSVFMGRGADGLETGLSGSIHTEVLDLIGARNVAAAAGSDKVARVSMEQLIQWNPDVILTQDPNYFARLDTSPLWQGIRAVRQKQTYLVPGVPFGWMDHPPGINRLLGMLWGMRVLYPDLLSQADYQDAVIRYFQLFYRYPLTPTELASFDGLARPA